MVEKLARDIEDADERARTMIEGQRAAGPAPAADVSRVTEAIRDLDQRIARMGERAARRSARSRAGARRHRLAAHRIAGRAADRPAGRRRRARGDHRRRAARPGSAHRRGQGAPHPAAPSRCRARPAESRPDRAHRAAAQRHRQPARRPRPARRRNRRPRPQAGRTGKGNDLAAAIAEISAHQRMLDERAETLAMRRDQKALSAAMAALRTDLAGARPSRWRRSTGPTPRTRARHSTSPAASRRCPPRGRSTVRCSPRIRADLASLRGMSWNRTPSSRRWSRSRRAPRRSRPGWKNLPAPAPTASRLDALGEEVSALGARSRPTTARAPSSGSKCASPNSLAASRPPSPAARSRRSIRPSSASSAAWRRSAPN